MSTLGIASWLTGGSPRAASEPYERTRSWTLLAPPLGPHPIATRPVIPIRDTTAFTVRVKGASSCDFPSAIYRPAPAGAVTICDGTQLFAPQSGGLNVAAQAENMILKLVLTRSRALLLGSTEWGSQAENSKSVPSRTRTAT